MDYALDGITKPEQNAGGEPSPQELRKGRVGLRAVGLPCIFLASVARLLRSTNNDKEPASFAAVPRQQSEPITSEQ